MNYKIIKLTGGQETLVNAEDYDLLSQYKWLLTRSGYAQTKIKRDGKTVNEYMHRLIMSAPKGMHVDHINGECLDNRRENLRVCTAAQNQGNSVKRMIGTSNYKGVHWCKEKRKWAAQIMVNRKQVTLGRFENEIDAAKAYNEAAKKHFGEYAKINFIPELRFKKLRPDAIAPIRAHPSDAGLDIFACDDVTIPPSMYFSYSQKVLIGQARVPSGIAVEIPPGYYGKVSSRSGLAFKSGLYAFDGTVDAGYRSEIGILLLNTTDRPYAVRKGDKVAQLIIIPCALAQPVEVDELSEAERGTNGFGSTGR